MLGLGFAAITLGHTVLKQARSAALSGALQAHEYQHVLDIEYLGATRFYIEYGAEALLGYGFDWITTGRADWHRPEVQLVYNVPSDPRTRQRKLFLLEAYLRDRERDGDRCLSLREAAARLYRHVLGSP